MLRYLSPNPQQLLMFLGAQNYNDERQLQLYHFELLKDIPNQFKEPKHKSLDTYFEHYGELEMTLIIFVS